MIKLKTKVQDLMTVAERVIGDYQVIKQIGQGTLGTVFLAEHRYLKEQVALKVLPEELASERSFIQRFEEEMGALASLIHPNIVRVHNVSCDKGVYYLVTDCIVDDLGETTNLGQFLKTNPKPLEEEELFRLLTQLAEALDYAHSKGVIHRGIKLNNVLLSGNGRDRKLFLSDFGLSRIVGSGRILTRTFQIVAEALGLGATTFNESDKLNLLHQPFLQGFAFIAPEQKRGECSIKSDVYAFGVLAYFLLVRKFPEGFFPLPSEEAPNYQLNWDSLIKNCLASDPDLRPQLILPLLKNIKNVSRVEEFAQDVASVKTQEEFALRPVIHTTHIERPQTDLDPGAIFNIDTTVKQYTPETKETREVQSIPSEMVVIPGGVFTRGSKDGNRDEMPPHKVTLDSFAIDIHPVTNEQFARFLVAMGGEKDSHHRDIIRLRDSRIKRSGGKVSIESGYLKHPVVGVTWYGAMSYAMWVGKRLPTEAEWEVAANGGVDGVHFPSGDHLEKTQANFFSSDTTPVLSYAPNGYGLYDMAGNVYEWCHDWYGYNYYEISVQEPVNPKGPLQGVYRVLRGGCWKSLQEDLRCSRRHRNNPGTVNGTYGFRCAAEVQKG